MAEVQGAAYSQVVVPEKRPETNPRPEAWEPGAPNYPWWTVNHKPKPDPQGERMTTVFLLAYIRELTRQHAEDWLDIETSRADLERQLVNLRKQSEVRG
jgi:hypothetical protein